MPAETFEDQWGPIERRLRRLWRAVRWRVKGAFGIERSILVEIRWRLGDEIMALPIYQALHGRHAPCRIAVWCHYPELLDGNPACAPLSSPNSDPDRYILLRGTQRNAHRLDDYARRARVNTPNLRPRLTQVPDRAPVDAELPRRPFVALAPGASWQTKRWPLERWRALAERLLASGFEIIELGIDGEAIGIGLDLTGRTNVSDAAAILRRAALVVASDSGLMHLALAVETPVVALFGPTEPSLLVRDEPLLHAITNARACAGCWNNSQTMTKPGVCPLGIASCLETITVDQVLAAVSAACAAEAA